MKIKLYPAPILRKKAAPAADADVEELSPRLITTMISYRGVGLAAVQVGIDKRIAVISDKSFEKIDKPLILVNPRIISTQGTQAIEEACLSVKGVSCKVKRADKIKVQTGTEENRKIIRASGLLSIVIQHEIDHLNGIVFPDRVAFPYRYWLLYKAKRNKKKNG